MKNFVIAGGSFPPASFSSILSTGLSLATMNYGEHTVIHIYRPHCWLTHSDAFLPPWLMMNSQWCLSAAMIADKFTVIYICSHDCWWAHSDLYLKPWLLVNSQWFISAAMIAGELTVIHIWSHDCWWTHSDSAERKNLRAWPRLNLQWSSLRLWTHIFPNHRSGELTVIQTRDFELWWIHCDSNKL
jgi:hypothetical protein